MKIWNEDREKVSSFEVWWVKSIYSVLLSLLCVHQIKSEVLCVSSAEKARLHAEAKAAEVTKRKAEAEAALLEKQKREVEREEARRALQRVLLFNLS